LDTGLEIIDLVKEAYEFNIGIGNFYIFSDFLVKSGELEKKYGEFIDGKFVHLIDPNDDGTPRRMFYRITQGGIRRLNRSKFQELREVDLGYGTANSPA
jgi:hypothetical protein